MIVFGCDLATLEPRASCGDAATWIAAIVTLFGVPVAIIAACIAWMQIRAARKLQREALARQTYAEYLKLAMEHPDFSSGLQPAETNSPSARQREQYEWYVSYMLNACEGILLYVSKRKNFQIGVVL